VTDVGNDIAALRSNVAALGNDVKRLATYGPELAHDSYATPFAETLFRRPSSQRASASLLACSSLARSAISTGRSSRASRTNPITSHMNW
jgi:hypothetical protein